MLCALADVCMWFCCLDGGGLGLYNEPALGSCCAAQQHGGLADCFPALPAVPHPLPLSTLPAQLVFTLIFTAAGQLDPTYCDQYPWERKLQVGGGCL